MTIECKPVDPAGCEPDPDLRLRADDDPQQNAILSLRCMLSPSKTQWAVLITDL